MVKTVEGKWVLFPVDGGQQIERWPIDGKLLLDSGEYTTEPPEGVEAKVPKSPPRHVGAPTSAPASVFVAPEGEDTAADEGAAKKKKR